MKDFQQKEIGRGPYIDVQTGMPFRIYELQSRLYCADPFDRFEKDQLPDLLTDAVAKNLLRLTEAERISRLLLDTKYIDHPAAPKIDTLPLKDAPFGSR